MSAQKTPDVLTLASPEDGSYQAVPGSDSFKMMSLRGDTAKEGGTFLSRMAPGAVAPWHWHTATEEFVVLKGTVVCQLQDNEPARLKTGAYSQLPARQVHRFRCTEDGECIVFVVGSGGYDLHWVDGKGREISEQEANRLAQIAGTADW